MRGRENILKKSKRTYILTAISITTLIYLIGMYYYRKPITLHKAYSNVIVSEPGAKKIVKAELNAKLYRGIYRGSIFDFNLHFINRIEGKIILDGKDYKFNGYTEKSKLVDILGNLYENDQNTSAVFWFKMNNLDSIEFLKVGQVYFNK